MSSRETILRSIRGHLPQSSPHPGHGGPWIQFPDPVAQFSAVLEMIGGKCHPVPDLETLNRELRELPQFASAKKCVSAVPNVGRSDLDVETVDDPHLLDDVDFAILPGQFAVAENGAVWVTDATLRQRVLYFLCQHLALVVPAKQIVHNMHEAYDRLSFQTATFGVFISGPSKTADIEQSLVIGAHGPKSMTVFLLDE